MTAKLRPRSRGVRFLARDSFLVDAASVVGTRAAVPGPGTLTTTDTNARMSISGGALVKNGALNINDVFHYTSTYVVAPGVASAPVKRDSTGGSSAGASPLLWNTGCARPSSVTLTG